MKLFLSDPEDPAGSEVFPLFVCFFLISVLSIYLLRLSISYNQTAFKLLLSPLLLYAFFFTIKRLLESRIFTAMSQWWLRCTRTTGRWSLAPAQRRSTMESCWLALFSTKLFVVICSSCDNFFFMTTGLKWSRPTFSRVHWLLKVADRRITLLIPFGGSVNEVPLGINYFHCCLKMQLFLKWPKSTRVTINKQ